MRLNDTEMELFQQICVDNGEEAPGNEEHWVDVIAGQICDVADDPMRLRDLWVTLLADEPSAEALFTEPFFQHTMVCLAYSVCYSSMMPDELVPQFKEISGLPDTRSEFRGMVGTEMETVSEAVTWSELIESFEALVEVVKSYQLP